MNAYPIQEYSILFLGNKLNSDSTLLCNPKSENSSRSEFFSSKNDISRNWQTLLSLFPLSITFLFPYSYFMNMQLVSSSSKEIYSFLSLHFQECTSHFTFKPGKQTRSQVPNPHVHPVPKQLPYAASYVLHFPRTFLFCIFLFVAHFVALCALLTKAFLSL